MKKVCKGNNHHRFPFTREMLVKYVQSSNTDRQLLVLAIVERKSNIHIGNISLSNIDFINSSCSFNIIVGEDSSWSKGIGYAAGKLLINHAFNELNLRRVELGTLSNNIAMQKLAEKLGFTEEGIKRKSIYKNGQYLDMRIYGLLKSDL